jgi:hypothetical protein
MTKAAIKKQIHAAVDIIDSEQLLHAVYVILNSELERKKEAMSPFTLEEFYSRNKQSKKEFKQGKLVAHRDVKAKYTLK